MDLDPPDCTDSGGSSSPKMLQNMFYGPKPAFQNYFFEIQNFFIFYCTLLP